MANSKRLPTSPKQVMHIVFTGGTGRPLGDAWKITTKKTDFYVEPSGDPTTSPFHISAHGPHGKHHSHRFHVKVDEGNFHKRELVYNHDIPRRGAEFIGKQLSENTYLIIRLRWSWHLGRSKFARYYSLNNFTAELSTSEQGYKLDEPLSANEVWDVDLVASYNRPHWPNMGAFWPETSPEAPSPRFGPIVNEAGMYLTGTSYRRTESRSPTPARVNPPLPTKDQTPNRILVGGSDNDGLYWLNQTITALDIVTGDDKYVDTIWPEYRLGEI